MKKVLKDNESNIVGNSIVWFRRDLRLADNPAICAAVEKGYPIIPLFIWAPDEEKPWQAGSASKVFLFHSLIAFSEELDKLDSKLIIRQGNTLAELRALIKQCHVKAIYWNRYYEPQIIARDKIIEETLREYSNLEVKSFNASLLYEPWQVKQKNDKPYKVFGPFWRACLQKGEPAPPLRAPRRLAIPKQWPYSLTAKNLELLPKIDWTGDIVRFWTPGSIAAKSKLNTFVTKHLKEYKNGRDRPDQNLVSYLSPYLHFGQLSPNQIFYSVQNAVKKNRNGKFSDSALTYLKELGWREFAYHLLFHFPHITNNPLHKEYERFPWQFRKDYLKAWQKGKTGYPIVDAGMRQLWQLGWMHNRVRMIVASFLVKDLLISWQEGSKWFWDTLVDADLANNTLGWQWSAGCGADAVPYFRVFNPIVQGNKFDPKGDYIKKFVPELKKLPIEYIHTPWLASKTILLKADIELGRHYPKPIVDHAHARLKAIAAWKFLQENIKTKIKEQK